MLNLIRLRINLRRAVLLKSESAFFNIVALMSLNVILFLRQHDLNTMEECIERAKEANIATLVINEDKKDISPEKLREFFVCNGVKVPVNKNAIVHTGEKYVTLYSLDDEEIDFCIDDKRVFEDVFSGKVYTFPTRLNKNTCYLFKR